MKARVLVVAALLFAGCAAPAAPSADPVLEPTGVETLPTWVRQPETGAAVLTIPADLLFATDSAELNGAALAVLSEVVAEARGSGAQVAVEGFADSDGDAAHNQLLSERRAEAVAEWLAANGVAPRAITTRGWGETRPAVEETDPAAKAKNRRVVITVTHTQGEQR